MCVILGFIARKSGSEITSTPAKTKMSYPINYKNIHKNIFSLKLAEKWKIFSVGQKNNILK